MTLQTEGPAAWHNAPIRPSTEETIESPASGMGE